VAEKSRIKVLTDLACDESAFFIVGIFLLHPHILEGVNELSGSSFIRAQISFMKVSPL
jgi:hypothetical protein